MRRKQEWKRTDSASTFFRNTFILSWMRDAYPPYETVYCLWVLLLNAPLIDDVSIQEMVE